MCLDCPSAQLSASCNLQEALLRGGLSDEEEDLGEEAQEGDAGSEDEGSEADEEAADAEALSGEDELEASEEDDDGEEEDASEAEEEETGSLQEEDADEDVPEEIPLDDAAVRESLVDGSQADIAGEEQQDRPRSRADARHSRKRKQQSEDPDSLQSLKRQLTEAKRNSTNSAIGTDVNNGDSAAAAPPQV